MNYTKIYKQLMERAKSENRTKKGLVYYESHHIIPDFMFLKRSRKGPKGHLLGNPNDKKNLVLLTEREHILAHILLAKSLTGKRYWAQAASALVWFYTKVCGEHSRQKNRIAGSMRKYERYRSLGLAGISAARKGKMPVVDVITREIIGSVLVDHPKVLAGEWVHHSKGKFTYVNITTGEKIFCFIDDIRLKTHNWKAAHSDITGKNNPNFKEFNTNRCDRLLCCITLSIIENHLSLSKLELAIKNEFIEFKKISLRWVTNNISIEELLIQYNILNCTNVQFNPYFRSNTQRKTTREKNSQYKWFTNGISNVRIKKTDTIPEHYYEGRTNPI